MAVISSFQYGYHIGVINTPKNTITNCSELIENSPDALGLPPCFKISEGEQNLNEMRQNQKTKKKQKKKKKGLWGTIVGLFAIGGLVGGLCSGYLADSLGRKKLMFLNNTIFIVVRIFTKEKEKKKEEKKKEEKKKKNLMNAR